MLGHIKTVQDLFLSTPSARRATSAPAVGQSWSLSISIHALREEGDKKAVPEMVDIYDFYPRPPRGGRPNEVDILMNVVVISIHALREEGDPDGSQTFQAQFDFYPRPPRGGRQWQGGCDYDLQLISIHALREEGDRYSLPVQVDRSISIHALREEGDSKNGEKHLRFCFIIKRSAQIWKSLSKNIRKRSCDLHRTA